MISAGQILMELSAPVAPAVRASDTSVAAARLIAPHLGRLEAQVLACIAQASDGRTCDEVEVVLEMSHQTCSARIRGLARLGKIKDSGRRLLTRSGRTAAVWIVA